MLNLRKQLTNYEEAARTFAELVPWMTLVSDDVVLCKDGSLLACYELRGVDVEGKDAFEVDQTVLRVENAMRAFANYNLTVWWTLDRRKAKPFPDSAYPNPGSAFIANTWAESLADGQMYQNRHWLSVMYTPAGGIDGFFNNVRYFMGTEKMGFLKAAAEAFRVSYLRKSAFAQVQAQIDEEREVFGERLALFEAGTVEYGIHKLRGKELVSYLHRRCSPSNEEMSVGETRLSAMYLDSYLPDSTLVVHNEQIECQHVARRYLGMLSVKDWPELTATGLYDHLMHVPGEITVTQIYRFKSTEEMEKRITAIRRNNLNAQKPLIGYVKEAITKEESDQVNEGRSLLAQDASAALAELTTGSASFGWFHMNVIAFGDTPDEVETVLKAANVAISSTGTISIRERLHLLSAFAGSMPGQWAEVVRWTTVSTANLSDICPVRSISTGDPQAKHLSHQMGRSMPAVAMLPTAWNTPYYFNFHQGDLGHTFVIGPSGTGKTVFVNFLIALYQKYAPSTFVFDKDYSAEIAVVMQEGEYIDLLGESGRQITLNPMAVVGRPEHRNWLKEWVEILITARGYKMTAEDDKDLWHGLEMLAALPRGQWRLGSLPGLIHSRLADQLAIWCGEGQFAKFFDNATDSFDLAKFTAFEMGGLFQNDVLARAFMEYAFFRIAERLDGSPTVIYVEEAWFCLADEKFAFKVMDWLKTLRKKNAIVILTTQSLDDVTKSDIFSSIIDNMPTRIFLPNPNARAYEELYRSKFGLNGTQIDQIMTATPKENYYIVTPGTSRMITLRLPDSILACLRSDPKTREIFAKHRAANDPEWRLKYLEQMTL